MFLGFHAGQRELLLPVLKHVWPNQVPLCFELTFWIALKSEQASWWWTINIVWSPSAKKCILRGGVHRRYTTLKNTFLVLSFWHPPGEKIQKRKWGGGSIFATTLSHLDLIHFPCFPCSWGNLGSQETPVVWYILRSCYSMFAGNRGESQANNTLPF